MWPRGPGGEQKPALLLTPGRTHHKPTRRRFTAHPLNAAQGRRDAPRPGSTAVTSRPRRAALSATLHEKSSCTGGTRGVRAAGGAPGSLPSRSRVCWLVSARASGNPLPGGSRVVTSNRLLLAQGPGFACFLHSFQASVGFTESNRAPGPAGTFPGAVPACLWGRRRMASPASE